jgi:hypothetical protein
MYLVLIVSEAWATCHIKLFIFYIDFDENCLYIIKLSFMNSCTGCMFGCAEMFVKELE